MPMDQGTFGGGAGMTLTRWYHNPLSGDCESFTYRGQGGNANNFESREHCESYCKQSKLAFGYEGPLGNLAIPLSLFYLPPASKALGISF